MGRQFILGALLLMLTSLSLAQSNTPTDPRDPWENYNRAMFQFNEGIDRAVLKPAAQVYQAVLPTPARRCISNVFGNIGDVWSAFNSLLQGKPGECAHQLMRVAINSTLGLGGCLDIAREMKGLEKLNEDFGQTLGVWGFEPGPYWVLPVFGPSSVRDGLGFMLDLRTDPARNIDHVATRNTAHGVRLISLRADLLQASRVFEDAALDRYTFTRDAYLQRRLNAVYDGEPPEEKQVSPDTE